MKKFLFLTGLVLLLAACTNGFRPPAKNPSGPKINPDGNYIEGQVVVGYTADSSAEEIASSLGGNVLHDWEVLHAAVIELPSGYSVEKAENLLNQRGDVRYAEPNRVYEKPDTGVNATAATVELLSRYSDPDFAKQWMHQQMHTEAAWEKGITGAGVRIGIHDDYIDHRHPDLVDNIAYPGFYGTTAKLICPNTPHNGVGTHGSSVSGTAAAVANSIGGRGVAYGAKIVPIAIDHPTEGYLTTVGIVYGAVFAALGPGAFGIEVPKDCGGYTPPKGRPYVDVLNMSWGGLTYGQVIKDAMDLMLSRGVILVTSAGNYPTTSFADPAWFPGLITVAASKPDGRRTDFSNRGMYLDVAAPGKNIWVPTTRDCILEDPTGAKCKGDEADYIFTGGTSFSSPATAGAVALILQAAGGPGKLDARQVRAILTSTAQDTNADKYPGFDKNLGWGIVDAGAAVAKALNIAAGKEKAPAPAANVDIFVTDKETNTPLPLTGAALQPLDKDGKPLPDRPILLSQTTGTGIFDVAGWASFYQIDPGRYRLLVGGPHKKKTNVDPDAYTAIIDVPSGYSKIPVKLNVKLPTDPYEPNNDTSKATPVKAGMSYKGIIYSKKGYDIDYYALPVTKGQTYIINTEKLGGNVDLVLVLLDSDGKTVIAKNDNNQDFTRDAWLSYTAKADKTVYIVVLDARKGSSPFNAYALDIASPLVTESEPNGSATVKSTTIEDVDFSKAQAVTVGSAVKAAIDPKGDDDVFSLELKANTILAVDVETLSNGAPDSMIAIYDKSGKMVAYNDDFTRRESRVHFKVPADGTYYVLVTAWDGDGPDTTTGNYTLSLTLLDVPKQK